MPRLGQCHVGAFPRGTLPETGRVAPRVAPRPTETCRDRLHRVLLRKGCALVFDGYDLRHSGGPDHLERKPRVHMVLVKAEEEHYHNVEDLKPLSTNYGTTDGLVRRYQEADDDVERLSATLKDRFRDRQGFETDSRLQFMGLYTQVEEEDESDDERDEPPRRSTRKRGRGAT